MTNEAVAAVGQTLSINAAMTAVSGLVAAIIATVVSWIICCLTLRSQQRNALHDMIDKVVMVAIEYPYLEDDNFCFSWPTTDRTTEQAMRYENYCCLLFNLLERLWKFHKGDDAQIEGLFYAREVIRRHRVWWKGDRNNLGGYEVEFHRYVDRMIEGEPK